MVKSQISLASVQEYSWIQDFEAVCPHSSKRNSLTHQTASLGSYCLLSIKNRVWSALGYMQQMYKAAYISGQKISDWIRVNCCFTFLCLYKDKKNRKKYLILQKKIIGYNHYKCVLLWNSVASYICNKHILWHLFEVHVLHGINVTYGHKNHRIR